jgi:hypothetical protein
MGAGVMQLVGEAKNESGEWVPSEFTDLCLAYIHTFTDLCLSLSPLGSYLPGLDIIVIGIVPWGCVANRHLVSGLQVQPVDRDPYIK